MHLHLLPLSGEATSAGTVTKKWKTVNTIKTQESSLAGETHLAAEATVQKESNDNNNSYYEQRPDTKCWVDSIYCVSPHN